MGVRALVVSSVVLAGGITVPAAVAASPASTCAVAWNKGSSAALRSKIAADHPRGAFIDNAGASNTMTVTWSKTKAAKETHGTGCSIQFILRSGDTVTVFGSWKSGAISTWDGPVPSNRPIPVPDNTTVHADGTVGFHG